MSLRLVAIMLILTTAAALGIMAYQVARPTMPGQSIKTEVEPLTVGFMVAARPLPAGTLLRDQDIAPKHVPAAKLPQGAVIDTAEDRISMRGAVLRHFVDAGAPVTTNDVVRADDRGFLATVLAPGTRAVTIGVDQVAGVAGLIWPGDLVDVILTQQFDAQTPLAHRVLSETILTAVRVIAVDQDIVQGGAPVPGATSSSATLAGRVAKTVTLQVGSDEAERLTVAEHLGHLSLAVRAIGEGASTAQAVVYSDDVSPSLSRLPLPTGSHVQVIEGDKQREVSFP